MKFETDYQAVGLFDAHHEPYNGVWHPAYQVAREYLFDIKPQVIVIGGDWGSFDSLSNWNAKKPLLAEDKRYNLEVEYCYDELFQIANRLHNSRKIFILGNHEQRAQWYVEKYPAMKEFVNIKKNLKLKELGFEVVDFNAHIDVGELSWTHGWYWNKYHARYNLDEFAGNILYGHVHHFQSDTKNVHYGKKELIAHSIGCLTDRYPDWKGKKPTRFQNGFVTVEYRIDGTFNIQPHLIINGEFSYGGYTWRA